MKQASPVKRASGSRKEDQRFASYEGMALQLYRKIYKPKPRRRIDNAAYMYGARCICGGLGG